MIGIDSAVLQKISKCDMLFSITLFLMGYMIREEVFITGIMLDICFNSTDPNVELALNTDRITKT